MKHEWKKKASKQVSKANKWTRYECEITIAKQYEQYETHSQEEGLHETGALIEDEDSRAEVKLRTTLEELASSAMKYVAITKNSLTGPGTGKTKLDKERMKLCEREIVNEMTLT